MVLLVRCQLKLSHSPVSTKVLSIGTINNGCTNCDHQLMNGAIDRSLFYQVAVVAWTCKARSPSNAVACGHWCTPEDPLSGLAVSHGECSGRRSTACRSALARDTAPTAPCLWWPLQTKLQRTGLPALPCKQNQLKQTHRRHSWSSLANRLAARGADRGGNMASATLASDSAAIVARNARRERLD